MNPRTTPTGSLFAGEALDALRELDRVHARLIAAVTPKHPGWINAKGPHSTPEDSERYDSLFSQWHSATRRCRALLGPNVHAEPNE